MKPIFIMMIGLAGSGKSTIAKKYAEEYNAIILSSDEIRKEIYGDEECQDNPGKVFELLHSRAKELLSAGTNVICDATNLSSKHRKHLLQNNFKKLDIESFAVIVTASLENCISRQSLRDRKVPESVIRRQLASFEFPVMEEGWTRKPEIYDNCTQQNTVDDILYELKCIDQKGKNHLEDAYIHSIKAFDKARELKPNDEIFQKAALYHDLGKLYTRTVDDNGNAHFYRHQNVSAYIYTSFMKNGVVSDTDYRLVQLIQYHDLIWQAGKKFDSFSEELKEDLRMINECDMAGTLLPEQLTEISLLDFISFFPDTWMQEIQKDPFNINVKVLDEFVLLKYDQLDTNFSYRLCRQCRGCILTKENNKWIYVCHPFDKFFNYGEFYADEINWRTEVQTTAKIDGSLMKVWFYNDKWHLSTNGTIDAFSAIIQNTEYSFGEIFEKALGYSVEELGKKYLDPGFTYMFELTSPETRVVIPYDYGVYFLSMRNMLSDLEVFNKRIYAPNLKYPEIYPLNTIDDIVSAAAALTKDEEGFVITDILGHRLKVKSPEYLIAAKLTANHNLSDKSIYRMILNGSVDDFIAYAPEYKDRIDKGVSKLITFKNKLEESWDRVSKVDYATKKDFALAVKNEFDSAYLFRKYDNKDFSVDEWIEKMTESRLLRMLERIE